MVHTRSTVKSPPSGGVGVDIAPTDDEGLSSVAVGSITSVDVASTAAAGSDGDDSATRRASWRSRSLCRLYKGRISDLSLRDLLTSIPRERKTVASVQ